MGQLILLRHGETEWSRDGRHTGRTDVPLTRRGEDAAAALAPVLARRDIGAVLTSPASRAVRTAELAGLARPDAPWQVKTDPDLQEWDYGGYEGRTTADIRKERPGWYLWRDGVVPGDAEHPGETVGQVGKRVDAVLALVRPMLSGADVVLVAHGHSLRILTARWLGLAPDGGRLFRLDTGTLSTLDTEHDMPVITSWNVPPPEPASS
jgi:broad specificity phosphatase PhoE